MRKIIVWVKSNPVAIVSALLCFASLISLFAVQVRGTHFIEAMKKREEVLRKITSFTMTPVKYPSNNLDAPSQTANIAINEKAIKSLEQVYALMGKEYREIFGLAVTLDRSGHIPMLEGLFPSPGKNSFKLFDARSAYRQAFKEMLQPYQHNTLYPKLDAGPPISLTRINNEVQREIETYLATAFFPARTSVSELTKKETAILEKRKRNRVISVMREHASKIHIYAQTDETKPNFPFKIGSWSNPGPLPRIDEIWEGQLDLWVQQDIVKAIATSNMVWDPQASVLTAPVKQILDVTPLLGYVGLNSAGGLSNRISDNVSGELESAEDRLPDDFNISPTGRRSNTIYDVKHVSVTLLVDTQLLPIFIENLKATNFMTILTLKIQDIDEYEFLRKGYLFGSGDIIKIEMLIESIWLREWTKRLMPKKTRKIVGISAKKKKRRK